MTSSSANSGGTRAGVLSSCWPTTTMSEYRAASVMRRSNSLSLPRLTSRHSASRSPGVAASNAALLAAAASTYSGLGQVATTPTCSANAR